MTKRYRIKDIAQMAGVSAGTVDRVIHNRGDVSPESRRKVEETLRKINYQPNLYLSSIGVKKQYTLFAVVPQFTKGEYWEQIELGIKRAVFEFSSIHLKIRFFYYDQFDLFSCRKAFTEASAQKCDAVLIGATFHDEAMHFTSQLSNRNIPYAFVDTLVNNTEPIAFFGPHPHMSGYIEAKLLLGMIEPGRDIALFQACRIGNESSTQTIPRKYGFMSYIKEHSPETKILFGQYYNSDIDASREMMDRFFAENRNVGGAVVFNSRAYIIGGYLRERDMRDVRLIGCGAIEPNVTLLKEGYISCLIAERPEYQGYMGIKALLEYLLYNKQGEVANYTPIDVIIAENVDFYLDAK